MIVLRYFLYYPLHLRSSLATCNRIYRLFFSFVTQFLTAYPNFVLSLRKIVVSTHPLLVKMTSQTGSINTFTLQSILHTRTWPMQFIQRGAGTRNWPTTRVQLEQLVQEQRRAIQIAHSSGNLVQNEWQRQTSRLLLFVECNDFKKSEDKATKSIPAGEAKSTRQRRPAGCRSEMIEYYSTCGFQRNPPSSSARPGLGQRPTVQILPNQTERNTTDTVHAFWSTKAF